MSAVRVARDVTQARRIPRVYDVCGPRTAQIVKRAGLTTQNEQRDDLAANFEKLFHDKTKNTRELARQAAEAHGLLLEYV